MHTVPDIVGDDQVHALGPGVRASWIQVVVSGSGNIRLGDSSTDIDTGLPVAAGGGMMLPWRGGLNWYALSGVFAYIPTGATVSVAYAD